MSKINISFEMYNQICVCILDKIREWGGEEIVTIMRGGQTAAHLIVRNSLSIPNGVFYPKNKSKDAFMYLQTNAKKIVFIEDMISTGYTYKEIDEFMKLNHPDKEWKIALICLDEKIERKDYPNILTYGIKSEHWITSYIDVNNSCPENVIVHSRDFINTSHPVEDLNKGIK